MARTYNGTTDKLVAAIGALNFAAPVTMAVIMRRNSTAWNSVIAARASGGAVQGWSMEIQSTGGGTGDTITWDSNGTSSNSTFTVLNADGWVLVVASKASGSAIPRFHKFVFSSGVFTHQNGSGAIANGTAPGGTGTVEIGGPWGTSTDWFGGDIAVAGVWNRVLSDAEVENLPFTVANWLSTSPSALWVLDQDTVTQKVVDLSGGGANESSRTGTTVGTTSAPINYGDGIWIPTIVKPSAGGDATVTHVIGNVVLGGSAPSLTSTSSVAHVIGNVALSGSAPVVSAGSGVAHTIGTVTLGASAPSMTAGSVVTHVIGNLVLGATAPSVTGTGSSSVSHVIGEVVLGSSPPSFTVLSTVTHTIGNLALQGGSHTITNGAVSTSVRYVTSPAPAILYLLNKEGPLA